VFFLILGEYQNIVNEHYDKLLQISLNAPFGREAIFVGSPMKYSLLLLYQLFYVG
jgi:hypothetical protein